LKDEIIVGICFRITVFYEWELVMNETIKLLTHILCDLRPKIPTNGAYLYCQTKDNQKSTFQAAQFLLDNSLTYRVLILNSKAKSGYPGFAKWKTMDMSDRNKINFTLWILQHLIR
jgi:hypothetical protein